MKALTEQETLKYVLDSLHRLNIKEAYPLLQNNFPDYDPSILFRTLVFQQCWVDICNNNFNDAIIHIQELGESPGQILYQMWRLTTRNKARQILYDYLHKNSILSEKDEENYSVLLKLIKSTNQETAQPKKQKSFFSFAQKSKTDTATNTGLNSQDQENIMKAFCETLKELTENDSEQKFESDEAMTNNYNENKTMIFPDLFEKLLPKETTSNSFIGNIKLIESQSPKMLKYLKKNEGSVVERLWVLHCEQKIPEMQQIFTDDITAFKSSGFDINSSSKPKKIFQFQHPNQQNSQSQATKKQKKLKCLKFCNIYYGQLNEYEKESLFDILAVNGYFVDHELEKTETLLYRICKNKLLFDQNWWNKATSLNFELFVKNFSVFCSTHNLYLPFEIFVINNPKAKEIDLSQDSHPLIRFIWDLWVKRDPFSASISNLQFNFGLETDVTDYEELWKNLPEDSLAPLSLFIWNKDQRRFLPDSNESVLLAKKLDKKFPLLSSLVRGKTPHPESAVVKPPEDEEKKWRFSLYTSKFDLELHDTIQSHFTQYDFSKIFTNYYGDENFSGQPPFPHFDHPDLISSPSDPPYIYYVKSMLPVSAFQQAVSDNASSDQFKDLCVKCMKEALTNKTVRLSALTFIELADFKFGSDFAVDFKLSVAIFDRLTQMGDSSQFDFNSMLNVDTPDPFSLVGTTVSNMMRSGMNNSSAFNELIITNLTSVFESKSQESAKFLQQRLHPTNVDVLLLSLLLGIRCNLPPDYGVIDVLASKMHPAELILFIDRAEEIGCKYDMNQVANIIREKMPNTSLKEPILFLLTQELPSIYNITKEDNENEAEIEPALVVYNALKSSENPCISLLKEAVMRQNSFYSILASSVEGADASMCALVTLMTMTDAFSFDVGNPPDEDARSRLFLEVINSLLLDGKSDEVLKSVEIFSKESVVLPIVEFYDSVFLFAFKRAQLAIDRFHTLIKRSQNCLHDDLLGKISVEDVLNTLFPLQEGLASHCSKKSQVHLFRYLLLLKGIASSDSSLVSPFLLPRVKLAEVIDGFDGVRKSLLGCNLIGDKKGLVSDLLKNHSMKLGEAAAKCLDLQPSQFIREWIEQQFLAASTPDEVTKAYFRVKESIRKPDTIIAECECDGEFDDDDEEEDFEINGYIDPLFFVSLFAAMIQYVLPSSISHIIGFAYRLLQSDKKETKGKEQFLARMKSLMLFLKILTDHSIDSAVLTPDRNSQEPSSPDSVRSILTIMFPPKDGENEYNAFVQSIKSEVPLNFTTPVNFSVDSISNLFAVSIDRAAEICLEEKGLEDAKLLIDWQNRKSPVISSLESIKILFDFFNSKSSHVVHIIDEDEDEKPTLCFTSKQKEILVTNGFKSSRFKEKMIDSFFLDSVEPKEIQDVLNSLASKQNGRVFRIISIHFQASTILRSYSESDPEYKAKSSPLVRPSLIFGNDARQRSFELLKSPLTMMVNQIDLTRELIQTESIQNKEVASFLSKNLIDTIVTQKERQGGNISFVLVDDFGDKFIEFAGLCGDTTLLGDRLLSFANQHVTKENEGDLAHSQKRVTILANIILHASLCTSRIDECAMMLDSLYEPFLTMNNEEKKTSKTTDTYRQIMKIVSTFPEPSLLPRFVKFVLQANEDEIDSMQQFGIGPKLCIEILNEARQSAQKFQPEKFFNITLAYKLHHEHARLQAESANILLSQIVNKGSEIEAETEETDSTSESGSSADFNALDKREQKKQKKIEKQKLKEEKIELKKLKKKGSKGADKMETILQESSRRFLLALAYSLHEKCYHLSMECLKKLSLISLQRELLNAASISSSSSNLIDKNLNVFGLTENEVLFLMKTKEFPFALTIAISYDMDNEQNWASSIFHQSIEKQGDDFLAAFLYFKPMTSNLWNAVVDKYREYFEPKERIDVGQDKEVKERMKLFLLKIPNLVERYRLYKKLNFINLVENMKEKHPVICEWCDKCI